MHPYNLNFSRDDWGETKKTFQVKLESSDKNHKKWEEFFNE
jgi:hypothetical protein